jgi:hypothetical protein
VIVLAHSCFSLLVTPSLPPLYVAELMFGDPGVGVTVG